MSYSGANEEVTGAPNLPLADPGARLDGNRTGRNTVVSECTADATYERSAPQAGNNLPTFVRVDVKGRTLTDNDGSGRKTEIKASSVVDDQLMLQGIKNGKAWNMVIGAEMGKWGGAVVEDDKSFALFGACTLP